MKSELSAYVDDVFGTAGLPEKSDLPVIFVAPLGAAIPEDGVFNYTTIDNLSQLATVKPRDVILFSEVQAEALSVLCKHAEQFGLEIKTLFGVPGSEYFVWFEDATFASERIAYGAFVAELRAASEVAEQTEAAERSGTKIESDRYTTRTGKVRYSETISAGDDSDVDE